MFDNILRNNVVQKCIYIDMYFTKTNDGSHAY
jgi:hypothetical protein